MYENFFPCINPEMMRYTEKIPYNDIYNNSNVNPSNENINPNPKAPNTNVAANPSGNKAAVSSSGCGYNPNNLELARAYMPNQTYVGLLPLNEGLKRGSIFPNINLKFPRL